MTDPIIAVDLFCGAGGFSEGLRQACADLGYDLKHAAINHWEPAINTHERNHPDADQYHSKVEQLHPPHVIRDLVNVDLDDVHQVDTHVDLLLAGPECTHFSNARGGKPVNEQKRMSPWQVLDWLEKLDVEAFVIENVGEIQSWGPVEDGEPTRDGTVFDAWINALNQLGYSVDWTTLTAADYGDPTSRERFFLVGRQGGTATFPEPTHDDADPKKPDRRAAAEIIDWSDPGRSIWTRDLSEPRVHSPPKHSTMQRIAEGIRRHCDDQLAPFADVLEELGRDEIRALREDRIIPAAYADAAAAALDEPFLVDVGDTVGPTTSYLLGQHSNSIPRDVTARPAPTVATSGKIQLCSAEPCLVKYYGTSPPQPVTDPLDTVTANGHKYALSTTVSILLRQGKGAHPVNLTERSMPTIPARGAHSLATIDAQPLIEPKNGINGGLYSNCPYTVNGQPLHTLTSEPQVHLVAPSLVRYSHGGRALDTDAPMPTIATERGGVFALSNPYLCPLYNPRPGQLPRTRDVDRPLMTVTASKSPAAVTTPHVWAFIDDCQGPAQATDEPLKTQPASDRYALCVPELWPWGLDVKYRMLQPRELQQAQGFPADYEIVGTKADRTEQIGNAVPVHLAKALCRHLLADETPSLSTYGGGIQADPDAEVPEYEEVTTSDD